MKLKKLIITIILLSASIGAVFYYLNNPINSNKEIIFKVHKAEKLMSISKRLEKKSLIKNYLFFYYYGQTLQHINNKKIHIGKYKLNTNYSNSKILNIIRNGKAISDQTLITIPEGYNIYDIARLFKEKNIISEEKNFIELVTNKNFLSKYNIPSDSAEGYLYPAGYFILKGESIKSIANRMIKEHIKNFPTKEFESNKTKINLSKHQLITIASLIEKETGVEKELRLVSSVYHNRIKKNMRLECDPTVIYALLRLNMYKGKLYPRQGDMKINSAYNTYLYKGLPPGPIANPSRKAILASMNPKKTNYIFFVAKDDKHHYFAETIKEHNKNVILYRNYANQKKLNKPVSPKS